MALASGRGLLISSSPPTSGKAGGQAGHRDWGQGGQAMARKVHLLRT